MKKHVIPINTYTNCEDDRLIERYFVPLIDEFEEFTNFDAEVIDSILECLLLQFRRRLNVKNFKSQPVAPYLRQIHKYVEINFRKPITLAELSSLAGLNPSYISRTFKSCFGQAPIDYAIALRLNEAAYYLRSTTMDIKDISQIVGYDDFYHFSKLFKRHYGKSPKEFRQNFSEGLNCK